MYVKCMHQSEDIPFSMRSIDMIRNPVYLLQPNFKMAVRCDFTILLMLTTTKCKVIATKHVSCAEICFYQISAFGGERLERYDCPEPG